MSSCTKGILIKLESQELPGILTEILTEMLSAEDQCDIHSDGRRLRVQVTSARVDDLIKKLEGQGIDFESVPETGWTGDTFGWHPTVPSLVNMLQRNGTLVSLDTVLAASRSSTSEAIWNDPMWARLIEEAASNSCITVRRGVVFDSTEFWQYESLTDLNPFGTTFEEVRQDFIDGLVEQATEEADEAMEALRDEGCPGHCKTETLLTKVIRDPLVRQTGPSGRLADGLDYYRIMRLRGSCMWLVIRVCS